SEGDAEGDVLESRHLRVPLHGAGPRRGRHEGLAQGHVARIVSGIRGYAGRVQRGGAMALDSNLRRPRPRSACLLLLGLAFAGLLAGSGHARPGGPTFTSGVYVDQQLAGGEPTIMADPLHGTLIYTAHEGTTHLYRDGIVSSPWGNFDFVANYCNQVSVWTSRDGGANWFRDRYL